ncbi:hypothetical protein C8J57DRAFT_1512873 [Mycena rebaudengoi]|nr:hypothetical protein C8J57DRAFT_1512873 [Mycena rebaudengoi]
MGGGPAPPAIRSNTASGNTGVEDILNALRRSLKHGSPYSGGVHEVPKDLVIYYEVEGRARIDLLNATENDLSALATVCEPLRVGEDCIAGHLDPHKFATRLDISASGLIDLITEMNGLDIYGPGPIVKPYSNNMRPNNMVGSLVVILPVVHAGGVFTVEQGSTIWNFDPASCLAGPSLASTIFLPYVALYHDVLHTISPVHHGYRVTLTYNLFIADRNPAVPSICTTTERQLEHKLRSLLSNPCFLPASGLLAFNLAHKYPMPPPPHLDLDWDAPPTLYARSEQRSSAARWGTLLQTLKGCDARYRSICQRVGLSPVIKLLYTIKNAERRSDTDLLLDEVADLSEVYEYVDVFGPMPNAEETITAQGVVLRRDAHRKAQLNEKKASSHALRVNDHQPFCVPIFEKQQKAVDAPPHSEDESPAEGIATHWLTECAENNCVLSPYARSDSLLDYKAGIPALFVPVPAVGEGIRGAVANLQS